MRIQMHGISRTPVVYYRIGTIKIYIQSHPDKRVWKGFFRFSFVESITDGGADEIPT